MQEDRGVPRRPIWLDTEVRHGATFRWTLPVPPRERQTREDPARHRGGSIEVLLVEDDPGDVLMTREAFEDNKVPNQLHVVSDGAEAM